MTAAGTSQGSARTADLAAITRLLVRFAKTGDDQLTAVADRLRDALSATPTSEAAALDLQVSAYASRR